MDVLDIFFPKRCVSCGKLGSYFCRDCLSKVEFIDKPICPVCQRQAIGGKTHPGCLGRYRLDGLVIGLRYRGPVRRAISKVKYKMVKDIGESLCRLLCKNIWKFDVPTNIVLVPVPLSGSRLRWRGFNQAELLAKLLSQKYKVESADILIRKQETKSQVGLNKKQRQKNVRGVFEINNSKPVGGRNIVLVDDVYTSGATMQECAKALKKAGAKSVWGMAIALG